MWTRRLAHSSPRPGFTILELMVVLTLIGVLLVLISSALLSGRSAARRLTCSNNLHQIGLALENYRSQHGRRPPTKSEYFALLPQLDQNELYERWLTDEGFSHQRLPVWECPSEVNADGADFFVNYGANQGVFGLKTFLIHATDRGYAEFWDGPGDPSDDGESNTALMADVVRGTKRSYPGDGPTGRAVQWPVAKIHDLSEDREALRMDCESLIPSVTLFEQAHFRSTESCPTIAGCAFYKHYQQPNHRSCVNGPGMAEIATGWGGFKTDTASSYHADGGVNVLYGDGRVKSVSPSVDLTVWRAAGTGAMGD